MDDAKNSFMAVAGKSKLPNCPLCEITNVIEKNHVGSIAKPNGKIIAVFDYHFDQEINLCYLQYKFDKFLTKNSLSHSYILKKLQSHPYLELGDETFSQTPGDS